jgi:hypothetical protein
MSVVKRVDLTDFAKEIGAYTENSIKELKAATVKGVAKSIPDLVAASPVDTGMYAASWDFNETEYGAIIGNYAPYAGIIENGARPFRPPLGPLLAWAKRVLRNQVSHQSGSVMRNTGQPESDYSPEVWALAIYTQKKISEQGMAPRHIMENTIPKILANIRAEMQRLL